MLQSLDKPQPILICIPRAERKPLLPHNCLKTFFEWAKIEIKPYRNRIYYEIKLSAWSVTPHLKWPYLLWQWRICCNSCLCSCPAARVRVRLGQSAPLDICDSQGIKLKGQLIINFRTVFQLRYCQVSLRFQQIRLDGLVYRPAPNE